MGVGEGGDVRLVGTKEQEWSGGSYGGNRCLDLTIT